MKTVLQALLTFAVSGAVAGAGQYFAGSGGALNWAQLGTAAALGALLGVVNHFRQPPSA